MLSITVLPYNGIRVQNGILNVVLLACLCPILAPKLVYVGSTCICAHVMVSYQILAWGGKNDRERVATIKAII